MNIFEVYIFNFKRFIFLLWDRLYNMEDMPSMDSRFKDMAGDMWQHRVNNYDWDDYWFLNDTRINMMTCSDDEFLRFLSETLHPLVRIDKDEIASLLKIYDTNLKADGYKLVVVKTISGRAIYGGVEIKSGKYTDEIIVKISEKLSILDSEYIIKQLDSLRIQTGIDSEKVIGECKELIESFCKAILEKEGYKEVDKYDFPDLVKETNEVLDLMPKKVSNKKRGSDIIKGILGSITNITYKVNELRGLYGSGHGKKASYSGLNERHASLVLGLTTTLLLFWVETYEMKK